MDDSIVKEYLDNIYQKAIELVGTENFITLSPDIKGNFDYIIEKSESSKAVFTVVMTSLIYKILNPKQDIRNHQTSIEGGYSGRSFDTKYITPFLKDKKFPAMAESGWLTRSLEQKVPYDEYYTGAIKPNVLKDAFLSVINNIERNEDLESKLLYILQELIVKRNSYVITLARPHNLPVSMIIHLLEQHFNARYLSDGVSRLPVLALYAVYQCMIKELKRFDGKKLLPIESHTSADTRSGRIGDIDIYTLDGNAFEAVEVKHNIPISLQIIKDGFEKFSKTQVNRYYFLSTCGIYDSENEVINKEIDRIKNIHGCHVIVNGIIDSLKYYLRLLDDTSEFIHNYASLMENDKSIKFEHKKMWNEIISSL